MDQTQVSLEMPNNLPYNSSHLDQQDAVMRIGIRTNSLLLPGLLILTDMIIFKLDVHTRGLAYRAAQLANLPIQALAPTNLFVRRILHAQVWTAFMFFGVIALTLFPAADAHAKKAKMQRYTKAIKSFPPVSTVAVLPINYNENMKPEEKTVIENAFAEALSELPYTITQVSLDDAELRNFYTVLTQELGGTDPEEFVPLQKQFIVAIKSKADVVVTASVEQRLAELKGATARWDGVSFGISYDGGKPKEYVEWRGTQTGLSLRLDGYSKEGVKLFSSWGALMFPKTADSEESRFIRRDNALATDTDKKNMRRGIKTSLKPFRKKLKPRK